MNNGVSLTLLRLDKVPAPETFLSPSELEKCLSFKIEKRRHDWLGGRYAAKTLLKEALDLKTPLTTIEISYDSSGRPVWASGEMSRLLSITHSGPFCAAAAGAAGTIFLGIDLEKVEPRAEAWYKDYFHTSELPSPDMDGATSLWTRKEALLKALGLGLNVDLLDIKLDEGLAPEFLRKALKRYEEMGEPSFTLNTITPEPGYYLSIVCETAPNLLKYNSLGR